MFDEDNREKPWTVEDYRNALEHRNIEIEQLRRDVAAQVRHTNWLVGQERARTEAAEAKAAYLDRRLRLWSAMPSANETSLNDELNQAEKIGWNWPFFGMGHFRGVGKAIPKVENYAPAAQISRRVRVARVIAWPISAAIRTLDAIRTAPQYVTACLTKFWLTSVAPEVLRATGRWPGNANPEEMPLDAYRAWREAGGYR